MIEREQEMSRNLDRVKAAPRVVERPRSLTPGPSTGVTGLHTITLHFHAIEDTP